MLSSKYTLCNCAICLLIICGNASVSVGLSSVHKTYKFMRGPVWHSTTVQNIFRQYIQPNAKPPNPNSNLNPNLNPKPHSACFVWIQLHLEMTASWDVPCWNFRLYLRSKYSLTFLLFFQWSCQVDDKQYRTTILYWNISTRETLVHGHLHT